jgi:hypothetical protein
MAEFPLGQLYGMYLGEERMCVGILVMQTSGTTDLMDPMDPSDFSC